LSSARAVTRSALAGRSASYLRVLHDGGAQRLAHAEAYGVDVPSLVEDGYVRVLSGHLGAVVTLGPAGLVTLGQSTAPITASSATHQVALREAVVLALSRGYHPATVTSRYVRMQDQGGHDHYVYIRVNSQPSTQRVSQLIRAHRAGLRRGKGTVILVVLDAAPYRHQCVRQPRLQVWELQ
jgi:hypothetical protein